MSAKYPNTPEPDDNELDTLDPELRQELQEMGIIYAVRLDTKFAAYLCCGRSLVDAVTEAEIAALRSTYADRLSLTSAERRYASSIPQTYEPKQNLLTL